MTIDGSGSGASRPIISRRRVIASNNKVDHMWSYDNMPSQRASLPEAGRFFAIGPKSSNGVTMSMVKRPASPKRVVTEPLNLFTTTAPSRCSSAPSRRHTTPTQPPPPRDTRRRVVANPPSGRLSLAFDTMEPPTPPPKPSVLPVGWKPSTILPGSRCEPAPTPEKHWSGRKMSPSFQSTPTVRVLQPAAQELVPERRGQAGVRPHDHGAALFGRRDETIVTADSRPQSLRTKITPFSADVPVARKPSTNPRHAMVTPQPSSVFLAPQPYGGAAGRVGSSTSQSVGLCLWDYKFSSLQKPSHSSLARTHQPRASTPQPQRRSAVDLAPTPVAPSGRRHVVPSYLAQSPSGSAWLA